MSLPQVHSDRRSAADPNGITVSMPTDHLVEEVNTSDKPLDKDFVEVPLSGNTSSDQNRNKNTAKKGKGKRTPKRVLHFSDGILEEYSDDDEITIFNNNGQSTKRHSSDSRVKTASNAVNPSTLGWLAWMWYYTVAVAARSVAMCDYLGESLSNFFGITSPKYQYAIDEYYREVAEEEEEKLRQVREREAAAAAGFASDHPAPAVASQPDHLSAPMGAGTPIPTGQQQQNLKLLDPSELLQAAPPLHPPTGSLPEEADSGTTALTNTDADIV